MKKYLLATLILALSVTVFSQDICLTALENELMDLLNQKRVENGLSEVKISRVLMLTANKNVEEIVTQSYLNFKPEKFGDYSGHFEQIRYSTTASTANAMVQSLLLPSKYSNYHTIILNTGDMQSYKWNSAGICIREKNIVIIFGEQKVEDMQYPVCDVEKFFMAEEVPHFPTFSAYIPQDAMVYIYATTYMGETLDYEINTLSSYIDKGTYLNIPLDEPSVAYFELYFVPQIASIVPTAPIYFKLGSDEKGKFEKTIEFKGNSVDEIKAYLATGADINGLKSEDANGYTMLHRAVMHDNMEAVKYLMEHGAEINLLSSDKENTICFCKSSQMFKYLIAFNPDLNVPNADEITLLHSYALVGLLEPIKYLVEEKNFDINAQDRSGGTSLLYAVQFKHYAIAEYLLLKGAKQIQGWGVYPIHDAVVNYDLEMLKLLVKYGADINAKDEEGYTPLAKAINFTDQTNQDVIDYLRSLGAKE
jgi:ankyrin repeat protein